MLYKKKIAIVIPAYNEEGFITKTLNSVPSYVDLIICVDDASKDNTFAEMKILSKKDKRIIILKNDVNKGVGYSVKKGFYKVLKVNVDYIIIAPGDNQCDLNKIKEFISICDRDNYDVCRGNRFLNKKDIHKMPIIRRLGNSFYSFITKFVSGYYSMFDFQSSFSAIKVKKIKELDINSLRDDYLFDNSLWINLNIVNARVKEIPSSVIYENEVSDVNYYKYVKSSIGYFIGAFFLRIYEKYLFNLHPIGVFFIMGSLLFFIGISFGGWIFINALQPHHQPATTATVMLCVVPFILGIQLLLQAIVLDIQNEPK